MEITSGAIQRIRQIKSHRKVSQNTSLRLELRENDICLKWDETGAKEGDLVTRKQGVEILVDPQTYLRIADYILDDAVLGDSRKFILRPRNALKKGNPNHYAGSRKEKTEETNHEK